MSADFDRVGASYEQQIRDSISFGGQDHDFFVRAKARHVLDLAERHLGDPGRLSALDVGCGPGLLDRHLGSLGSLEGVDLSQEMVALARKRNPGVRYHVGDGSSLPVPEDSFDLVFASCVLHHVPPPERGSFVAELRRVTRPGGLVVVLEHNPLNPLTRLAVHRCAFDEDAILLGLRETRRRLAAAGLRHAEARYILFLPWGGRVTDEAERRLGRVPVGAQYAVAARA